MGVYHGTDMGLDVSDDVFWIKDYDHITKNRCIDDFYNTYNANNYSVSIYAESHCDIVDDKGKCCDCPCGHTKATKNIAVDCFKQFPTEQCWP